VHGDAGIGKTILPDAVAERATAEGFQVLRTAGVDSEAHLPFAGLHDLLHPLLGAADGLAGPQRGRWAWPTALPPRTSSSRSPR